MDWQRSRGRQELSEHFSLSLPKDIFINRLVGKDCVTPLNVGLLGLSLPREKSKREGRKEEDPRDTERIDRLMFHSSSFLCPGLPVIVSLKQSSVYGVRHPRQTARRTPTLRKSYPCYLKHATPFKGLREEAAADDSSVTDDLRSD